MTAKALLEVFARGLVQGMVFRGCDPSCILIMYERAKAESMTKRCSYIPACNWKEMEIHIPCWKCFSTCRHAALKYQMSCFRRSNYIITDKGLEFLRRQRLEKSSYIDILISRGKERKHSCTQDPFFCCAEELSDQYLVVNKKAEQCLSVLEIAPQDWLPARFMKRMEPSLLVETLVCFDQQLTRRSPSLGKLARQNVTEERIKTLNILVRDWILTVSDLIGSPTLIWTDVKRIA